MRKITVPCRTSAFPLCIQGEVEAGIMTPRSLCPVYRHLEHKLGDQYLESPTTPEL